MAYVPKHHRRRFGWVRKLPSGRWQARYKGNDSVLRPAPHTFRTKGMAEQWLAGVEADLMRGSWTVPNPSSESVAVWAERWMASKLNLKPKTKADYEMAIRVHILPRWGNAPISKITRGDIQTWIGELIKDGKSAAVIRRATGTLSRVLEEAVNTGALAAIMKAAAVWRRSWNLVSFGNPARNTAGLKCLL